MTAASTTDPACPEVIEPLAPARARSIPDASPARVLLAVRRPFAAIDPGAWDDLAAANPWSTPFSRWAFHRAWWDAYGEGDDSYDETLVAIDPNASPGQPGSLERPVGIVPLMHRHAREPGDEAARTTLRGPGEPELTPTAPTARAVYFGASYHADYATVLAAPVDLPAVADAFAAALAGADDAAPADPDHPEPWDVLDLRRLRCGDPAVDALAAAFGAREMTSGWTLNLEREDVCPVAVLPADGDLETFLAGLDKKERHEIRRKVRRAEAAGEIRLEPSTDPLADLAAFIDLHQARWGDDGLFPPTAGGDRSRVQFRRMFELFGAAHDGSSADANPLRLAFLTVDGRRIAAGVTFETADTVMYYNAGVDPDARDLSPGVLLVERLIRSALEAGKRRFDFLRGDEPYKYGWGAVDEPIQRLLVRRTVDG